MYPLRQTYFVFGLSRSGKSAAEFLLAHGAMVYIYDDVISDRMNELTKTLFGKGAKRVEKEMLEKMPDICDVMVISPGIAVDHPLAVAFKRKRKAVVGETELAARYMRCPIVAVTGTNGKTTTVSMIAEALSKGGYKAKACGNIGSPMLDFCDLEENAVAVAEISSFQLETLHSLCPHVAVVLNVSEDHLNRHYNMENYIFLKSKLLRNCTEAEYAVLNYDDRTVRGFAEKTKANVLYFSLHDRVRGAFHENGNLYFGKEKIISVTELGVSGVHNVQNALAVIAVSKIMGIKTSDIQTALAGFKGVRHRLEKIAVIDGVTYIDDSKGTNVDATLKGIAAMNEETVLLLGGKNKGYNYTNLFSKLPSTKVKYAVLYGENRYALLQSAKECGFSAFAVCDGFDMAIQIASIKAKQGQTVLLSPASASFDEFTSYEERGDRFVEIVRGFETRRLEKGARAGDGEHSNAGVDKTEGIVEGESE